MIHFGTQAVVDIDATATVKTFTLLVAVKRASSACHGFSSTALINGKQRLIVNIMLNID